MKDDQDEKKQQKMASTSDSSSLGSGHVIDLVNMETTGFQKRLWDRVLEEESRKLRAQAPANLRGAMLLPVPTAASRGVAQQQQLALAEECLQRLTTQYNQRGWSRRVSIIRDIFESVQPFTVAVNTVVQASDAAAISWGCLTLVFTVSPTSPPFTSPQANAGLSDKSRPYCVSRASGTICSRSSRTLPRRCQGCMPTPTFTTHRAYIQPSGLCTAASMAYA
jgi:hypothetical protein